MAPAPRPRCRGELAGILEVADRIASFDWDLDEVRRQHQLLARHMAAEVELLLGLAAAPATGLARAG